jgi:hypothetical protein
VISENLQKGYLKQLITPCIFSQKQKPVPFISSIQKAVVLKRKIASGALHYENAREVHISAIAC